MSSQNKNEHDGMGIDLGIVKLFHVPKVYSNMKSKGNPKNW